MHIAAINPIIEWGGIMSQFKTLVFFVGVTILMVSQPTMASEITLPSSSNNLGSSSESSAEQYEEQVTCALKASGAKSEKQLERVKYVAKSLGTVFSQMSPELKANFIRHMLAQGSAETDNLRLLEEEKSKYASSKSKHKGRGLIQTTHPDNYAKLAGCEKVLNQKPHPSRITHEDIAKAPKLEGSDVVRKPERVVNEKDERGKNLIALGALCYFLDTKERHPKFAAALEGTSDKDINDVGVALNKGPGKLGKAKEPLHPEKRRKAFKDMKECF